MNLAEMLAEQKRLLAEMESLEAEAKTAGGTMTAEQLTNYTAASDAYDAIAEKIVAQKEADAKAAAIATKNAERRKALNATGAGRKTSANPVDDGTEKTVIGKVKEGFESDPKKGFKTHREFLSTVIDAGRGRVVDPRLQFLATVGSDEARTNSDPAGGFLVPEGFAPDMLTIQAEADPFAGRTTQLPMQFPVVKIPARVDTAHNTSVAGGLTVTRRPETVAGTASQMTMTRVVMEAQELFGLSYATEEMLTDSPQSFAALLAAGFSDQFTAHLINERLNGSGVGEFQGVISAACTVSVAKETGQAADTILYENVIKMRSRCWGYGNAIWLANHDCMPQLMLMNQAVGTGGMPVWQPSAQEDHPDMLLGRPLIFTEFCKTVGDKGDLVCGNYTQYLEGTYQPLESAESMHVRFVNHERAFKFWLRNAGQPWWKAALTPKNSTATLSPFVVLDARE